MTYNPVESRESQPFKTFKIDKNDIPLELSTGRSYFDTRTHVLRLHLLQANKTLQFDFDKSLLLGRILPDEQHTLDLLDYGGQRYGISRRHAIILRHNLTLMIQDLRSSNGTFLNGERLLPHHAVVLRDDDMLMLGKLQMRVIFAPRWQ